MSSTPLLLVLDDPRALALHPAARAAFEAWLALPEGVRRTSGAPVAIAVATPAIRHGEAPRLVSGFVACLRARRSGATLAAVVMALDDDAVRRMAWSEPSALAAAIRHGRESAADDRPAREARAVSLLEAALRARRAP